MKNEPLVIDLANPSASVTDALIPGCVIAVDSQDGPLSSHADRIAGAATLSLTETPADDARFIQVPSIADTITLLTDRIAEYPTAVAICDDVLRANECATSTFNAVMTESLAYSTLQSGQEFRRWLAQQGPRQLADPSDPVLTTRTDNALSITLNQPARHNAFSNTLRAGLIDALTIADYDPTITNIELRGNGHSFCSGGDLTEFGTFTDPAAAHLARTRYSPALLLDKLQQRLGTNLTAHVHGATMGSGLEMAAFCGHITASPTTAFGLPELNLGLIPGAGGTVSMPRRIGRWRTAYLILTGHNINATTALDWGLIDTIDT